MNPVLVDHSVFGVILKRNDFGVLSLLKCRKMVICFLNLSKFRGQNECGISGSFRFPPTYIIKVGTLLHRSEVGKRNKREIIFFTEKPPYNSKLGFRVYTHYNWVRDPCNDLLPPSVVHRIDTLAQEIPDLYLYFQSIPNRFLGYS